MNITPWHNQGGVWRPLAPPSPPPQVAPPPKEDIVAWLAAVLAALCKSRQEHVEIMAAIAEGAPTSFNSHIRVERGGGGPTVVTVTVELYNEGQADTIRAMTEEPGASEYERDFGTGDGANG